jgi:hypothetical protein
VGRLAVALAIAGLLVRLARQPEASRGALTRPAVVVGVVALLLVAVSLGRYVQTFLSGGHGRYLFPVLPVILAGLIAGWTGLLPRGVRRPALGAIALGMAALGAATPLLIIAPGYALAGEVSAARAASLPAEPIAVFGDAIEIVSATVAPTTLRPGEEALVDLVWRARRPLGRSYQVFVQFVGAERGVGGVNRAPGGGLAATVRWITGTVVADRFVVPVAGDAPAGLYEVRTGFFMPTTGERLPVSAGPDRGGATVVGRVKVPPAPSGPPAVRLDLEYGGDVALEGRGQLTAAAPGQSLPVELHWRALRRPAADYSLSLQLVGPAGVVAQVDGPLGGALPTSAWEQDERLMTRSTLSLPTTVSAGTYTLHAIVYRLPDGRRLEAGGSDAPRIADVPVGRP